MADFGRPTVAVFGRLADRLLQPNRFGRPTLILKSATSPTLYDTCCFALTNSPLVDLSFSTVFRRFEMHSASCIHHFIHPVFIFNLGAIISKTTPFLPTVLQESLPALNR